MAKSKKYLLDFEVDKLTNSIENTFTGDSFQTDIIRLSKHDLKLISSEKGWLFDWKFEHAQNDRDVYKLTIQNNPTIIQGLISFTIKADHVYMNLLESASFNKGKNKIYNGVAGNLVAYACKVSFQHGNDGFVSFTSKTQLISHYEKTLGAYHFGGHLMVIENKAAQILVDKYFKN